MDTKCIHHIEFGVQNGKKHVTSFLNQYKFQLAGVRSSKLAKQWLLCSHAVKFLITELSNQLPNTCKDPYVHIWNFPGSNHRPKEDSVFNVALRVNNIQGCVERLSKNKVEILKPIQTFSDNLGSVQTCIVKSCVGNVIHTLVDDSKYSGLFLPGFEAATNADLHEGIDNNFLLQKNQSSQSDSSLHHIDHVTFCAENGTSGNIIDWYERSFGMKRFLINRYFL